MPHPCTIEVAPESDPGDLVSTKGRFGLLRLLPDTVKQSLLEAAHSLNVPDGHVLYRQGDIGGSLFCIMSGEVRLTLLRPDGRELVFVNYEAGDCCGLSSLIDGGPLPHTAVAHGPVQLKVLSRRAFQDLRAEHRAFEDALLKLLCSHIRVLSDYVSGASLDDLAHRVARKLIEVARERADGALVVRMSQTEMALLLGVSRQAMNRQLRQFEEAELLVINYGSVTVCNLAGLRTRAMLE